MIFAFDRDWTVDVNPHPSRQAVPLDWVRTLAHETHHRVCAIGTDELLTVIEAVNEEVRRNACRALGHLAAVLPDGAGSDGETVAVDDPGDPDRATVAAALEHRQRTDEVVEVSQAAAEALGRVRSAEGPR